MTKQHHKRPHSRREETMRLLEVVLDECLRDECQERKEVKTLRHHIEDFWRGRAAVHDDLVRRSRG